VKPLDEIVAIACQCGNVFQVDKKQYLNSLIQCPNCETIIQPTDHLENKDDKNE